MERESRDGVRRTAAGPIQVEQLAGRAMRPRLGIPARHSGMFRA